MPAPTLAPQTPVARARSGPGGNAWLIRPRAQASTAPPPSPVSTRPPMNVAELWAVAQTTDPAATTASPRAKTRRRPRSSPSAPAGSRATARPRAIALSSHGTAVGPGVEVGSSAGDRGQGGHEGDERQQGRPGCHRQGRAAAPDRTGAGRAGVRCWSRGRPRGVGRTVLPTRKVARSRSDVQTFSGDPCRCHCSRTCPVGRARSRAPSRSSGTGGPCSWCARCRSATTASPTSPVAPAHRATGSARGSPTWSPSASSRSAQYSDAPPRSDYHLTESGRDLLPVLQALLTWGDRWVAPTAPERVHHDHALDAAWVCRTCGEPVGDALPRRREPWPRGLGGAAAEHGDPRRRRRRPVAGVLRGAGLAGPDGAGHGVLPGRRPRRGALGPRRARGRQRRPARDRRRRPGAQRPVAGRGRRRRRGGGGCRRHRDPCAGRDLLRRLRRATCSTRTATRGRWPTTRASRWPTTAA